MNLQIRPLSTKDTEALIQLTLLAFEPVFCSFAHILGEQIYPVIYPDWKKKQTEWVKTLCKDEQYFVWVAETDSSAVGFIAYKCSNRDKTAEVQFLAVHPDYQNAGIRTKLNQFVLDKMQAAGMDIAVVGTGGDDSHAPARRSYEKAGYRPLPLVRYYKKL